MKKMLCPIHKVSLLRKQIIYGYPTIEDYNKDVIFGGCCLTKSSPRYGYECPIDKKVYIRKGSKLKQLDEDD